MRLCTGLVRVRDLKRKIVAVLAASTSSSGARIESYKLPYYAGRIVSAVSTAAGGGLGPRDFVRLCVEYELDGDKLVFKWDTLRAETFTRTGVFRGAEPAVEAEAVETAGEILYRVYARYSATVKRLSGVLRARVSDGRVRGRDIIALSGEYGYYLLSAETEYTGNLARDLERLLGEAVAAGKRLPPSVVKTLIGELRP